MSVAAIIVAAGRGTRAGGAVPKQFQRVGGKSVLLRSLEVFLPHGGISRVQPVIHPDDRHLFEASLSSLPPDRAKRLSPPVPGGPTRQLSVLNGLEALARGDARPSLVLIHDAARPFATSALVDRAIAAGRKHGAAVPGVPVADTIKVIGEDSVVRETPARDSLRAVQTPQAFGFEAILKAHRAAAKGGLSSFTDDGALAEWAGLQVSVFEGDADNIKVTHAEDLSEHRAGRGRALGITRVATGFDVHAYAAGDHIWLGGVRVAHERGVSAHSDGDVVLHALTDALLGALGEGDIGLHFPPSDPQWRGASSDRFLAFAAARVRLRGGVIDHLDATVLCEAPRIDMHRDAMRVRIAEIAGVVISSVSIKATTTEGLGFIGRGEGIAAQATATIRLPAREDQ